MEKFKVFMIMPFKEEFLQLYETLKTNLGDEYEFSNAGEEGNQQNILIDIFHPLKNAQVVIADLTGLNPNVMYELGVAHAFEKKTIVITQDDLITLPFDLKQYRAKKYTTHFAQYTELVKYLKTNLDGGVNDTIEYSNPVKDSLSLVKIEIKSSATEKPIITKEIDTTQKNEIINNLDSSISDTDTKVKMLIKEIEIFKIRITPLVTRADEIVRNSGTLEEIKHSIKSFALTLPGNNKAITSLWNEIEINTPELLENKNKEYITKYRKSLHSLKDLMKNVNFYVTELKEILENNKITNPSMNQIIESSIDNLSYYYTTTQNAQTSINKILEKISRIIY